MRRSMFLSLAGFLILSVVPNPVQAADPPTPGAPALVPVGAPIDIPSPGAVVSDWVDTTATPMTQGTAPAPSAPAPTTDERLTTLEGKLTELSKSLTVTTAGGDVKLIIGGAVVADLLYNEKRPIAPGTPFLLSPGSAAGFSQNTFDANARQTNLFLKAIGPKLCDEWETSATVAVNLYDNSIIADQYGLLPILAYGEIRNKDSALQRGLAARHLLAARSDHARVQLALRRRE